MNDLAQVRLEDYPRHMTEAIGLIQTYLADCSETDFLNTRMIQDAAIRNIEILGEASNRILKKHPEFANAHGEVPWEAIYYMRNRIIHGYASVNYERVWQVVTRDLPVLQSQLSTIKI